MSQTRKKRQRIPVNKVTTGCRVSDELWAVLERVLPMHINTHRFGGGKPRTPDRQYADAIFFVLRTDCQWRAVAATGLCPHSTAHDRFQQWVQAGVFLQLWQAGGEQFNEWQGLDWGWLSRNGAMTKAPLSGEKNGPQSYRPCQVRGQTQFANRGVVSEIAPTGNRCGRT